MKHKVTVYGSLLQGLGNHALFTRHNAKLLGEFETEPKYTMISLGGFPGVIEKGDTAIQTEVYEVDDDCLNSLDRLEGYTGKGDNNFYNREVIKTSFGDSFVYFINNNYFDKERIIKSGNWREYTKERAVNYG